MQLWVTMAFSYWMTILVLFFSANILFDLKLSLGLQEDKLRSLIQSPNIIHGQLQAPSLALASNSLHGMHSTHFYPNEMFMKVFLRGVVKHLYVNNVRNTPMWMKEERNTSRCERTENSKEKTASPSRTGLPSWHSCYVQQHFMTLREKLRGSQRFQPWYHWAVELMPPTASSRTSLYAKN